MPVLSKVRIAILLLLVGCASNATEKARIRTSDGRIEAVVVERQTGATVDTPTEVYLVAAGAAIGKDPVFVADKVDGFVVNWSGPRLLEISYKKARIFKFTNFFGDGTATPIEIRLVPQGPNSLL